MLSSRKHEYSEAGVQKIYEAVHDSKGWISEISSAESVSATTKQPSQLVDNGSAIKPRH